jgi:hypothetical protein
MLTQEQLDRGAAYLAGCANRDGEISGGYSWRELAAITGEEPGAPGAGLILFAELRAAGRLVDLEPLPGTYGHSRFRIVAAPAADPKPRSRAGIRAAMEARDVLHRAPKQAGLDLGGFGTRSQPTLL